MIWNQEKQRVGWLPDAEPSLDGGRGGAGEMGEMGAERAMALMNVG